MAPADSASPPPAGTRATVIERTRQALLALCFCAFLIIPIAGQLLKLDPTPARTEKRNLAPRPALPRSTEDLKNFPPAFEAYYNDHFGFRNRLIDWNARANVGWFGVSPTKQVVIGDDGWLFYTGTEEASIKDFRRTLKPLSPAALENWRMQMEKVQAWCDARKIPLLIVIAPDKHSIYPEFMPLALRRSRREGPSRLDQLLAYLAKQSSLPILDLRERLLKDYKSSGPLYHKTDTHWNELGAWVGYEAIMDRLNTMLPGRFPIRQRLGHTVRKGGAPGGDLALMMGDPTLSDDAVDLALTSDRGFKTLVDDPLGNGLITESPDASLPRAVIFRDSFAIRLIPLMSSSFSRAVYRWQAWFNPELVEQERAEVVIFEIVERDVFNLAPIPEGAE